MKEYSIPQISVKLQNQGMICNAGNSSKQNAFNSELKMIKPKNYIGENKCNSRGIFSFKYFFKSGKNKSVKNDVISHF